MFECIGKKVYQNLVKIMSPIAAKVAIDPISVMDTYFQVFSPPSTMQGEIDIF